MIEASKLVAVKAESRFRRHLHDFWGEHRSMCTHSIDDLLPHAPLHYAATGEMVKGSYIYKRKISIDITCVGLASARPNNVPKSRRVQKVTKQSYPSPQ